MLDEHERTMAFAELALGQIKSLRQTAVPRNYEIWYVYATGYNSPLNKIINETLARNGKLSESDVDAAMREIRLALLEADVNFKVVKSFTKTLKERCLGSDVMNSLDPGQQVVKIVNEELASLMGGTGSELAMAHSGPTVILMAGLQGSGKTTACAKLARHFGKQGKDVALAACDVYRPAAVEQLVAVGGSDAG